MLETRLAPPIHKGPKILDGKKLQDGQSPCYESWKIYVQGKMRALTHQYGILVTNPHIKSVHKGDVADHLIAQIYNNTINPYLNTNNVFKHLVLVLHGPITARDWCKVCPINLQG